MRVEKEDNTCGNEGYDTYEEDTGEQFRRRRTPTTMPEYKVMPLRFEKEAEGRDKEKERAGREGNRMIRSK